ncbi:hypothetical protein MPTK1_8g10410 [Marchantia polymorpha subsp. ruderalis]
MAPSIFTKMNHTSRMPLLQGSREAMRGERIEASPSQSGTHDWVPGIVARRCDWSEHTCVFEYASKHKSASNRHLMGIILVLRPPPCTSESDSP